LQHCHQPARCGLAQIAAPKNIAGFAEKFDAAESAAAQRVHATRPSLPRALNRIFDIAGQPLGISCTHFCHGDPRKTDPGRSMTPLTWPRRGPFCAEIGPVLSTGIVTRIFKCNAF
jgi:hypothetical protein